MILMREVTAARSDSGSVSTVCSMPSRRKRMRRQSSRGSTWMSEACASTARAIMSCTRRMMGASLAMSSRRRTSSSLARSDAVGAASSLTVAPRPYSRSSARSISPAPMMRCSTGRPSR